MLRYNSKKKKIAALDKIHDFIQLHDMLTQN